MKKHYTYEVIDMESIHLPPHTFVSEVIFQGTQEQCDGVLKYLRDKHKDEDTTRFKSQISK